jgi:hypothetical protein
MVINFGIKLVELQKIGSLRGCIFRIENHLKLWEEGVKCNFSIKKNLKNKVGEEVGGTWWEHFLGFYNSMYIFQIIIIIIIVCTYVDFFFFFFDMSTQG